MKIRVVKAPEGVEYDDSPQRSPEWLRIRSGRIGASDLSKWMAVSKRDGKPLKARLDKEREIAFEKAFGVPFSRYVTSAMQDGIDNEDYVREQYSAQTGNPVHKAGAFYDKWSVASPDGLVGDDGGIEIKWLQDSNWTLVVESGAPLPEHMYQIQGNLRLSGRKWWDYIAGNESTGRFIVIRVKRDEDMIASIGEAVKAVEHIEPMNTEGLYQFTGVIPDVVTEQENVWA